MEFVPPDTTTETTDLRSIVSNQTRDDEQTDYVMSELGTAGVDSAWELAAVDTDRVAEGSLLESQFINELLESVRDSIKGYLVTYTVVEAWRWRVADPPCADTPTEWPMFGGTQNNMRWGSLISPLETGETKWEFTTDDDVRSSPAVNGHLVLIGCDDGLVYGVNIVSGDTVWEYRPNTYVGKPVGRFRSSPTVTQSVLLLGRDAGELYALSSKSGSEQSKFKTENRIRTSPAVADGKVYIVGDSGKLHAKYIDRPDTYWTYHVGNKVRSSPAVSRDTVYFGCRDKHLYAIDAETGEEDWVLNTGAIVDSSPAVDGSHVYIGNDEGVIYSVDKQTGEVQWQYETGNTVTSSPAIVGNTVYYGNDDGNFYALNVDNGDEEWSQGFNSSVKIRYSPAIAEGFVFCANYDSLYALHPSTRDVVWSYSDHRIRSSPTVAHGTVFIGTEDGVSANKGVTGESDHLDV
ncbi:PQQ-binding-like beta-propeller repeat protein [Salinigranum halophilum]|uniref:PQQ-binding-like beta-propeller repeat protein n=1 Tax=Salinigranum halophilum TaxID=2565931 RepID=UPI0013759209|nr:PQQ-binding-like beta-propeller repeat protein [Salinigranum halophilum]